MSTDIILIYTLMDKMHKAQEMATLLLSEKLIACANIYEVKSVYNWEGKILSEKEYRLDIKTSPQVKNKVISRIEALHDYDIPCIISHVIECNPSYGKWLISQIDLK